MLLFVRILPTYDVIREQRYMSLYCQSHDPLSAKVSSAFLIMVQQYSLINKQKYKHLYPIHTFDCTVSYIVSTLSKSLFEILRGIEYHVCSVPPETVQSHWKQNIVHLTIFHTRSHTHRHSGSIQERRLVKLLYLSSK